MYPSTIRHGLARPSLLFTTMESALHAGASVTSNTGTTAASSSSSSSFSSSSTSSSSFLPIHRIHLPSVDSTNTYAKQNAHKFPSRSLTVITTDEQTAGRGRLGRVWKSSEKNQDITLTFTFPLDPTVLPYAYQLSPLLSIAAVRALAKVQVTATIKWPNDIIVGNCCKLGGILCELESVVVESPPDSTSTSSSSSTMWAALGIGLNINSEPEVLNIARPVWPLTTLYAESNKQIRYNVDEITTYLINEMGTMLPVFFKEGFQPFHQEYEKYSILLGKYVQFRIEDNRIVKGKVTSIGKDGKLYIQSLPVSSSSSVVGDTKFSEDMNIRGYLSGEVSGIELIPGEQMIEGMHD